MITINNRIVFLLSLSLFLVSPNLTSQVVEEIIVKGDWRQTTIEKEDSSIVVLDEELIKSQPVKHFEMLSYLIPNLNFAASDSRARYFQIRGIGERGGYEGTPNSSVGFLIDDIDYSGQGGIATTFDVDQIEVHRGPQGSRIGANALAGLIYIKTKDPTDEFEGISEITSGDFGLFNAGIAFGGPLDQNKDITYRIALRKDYSDGFRKNQFLNKSDTSKKDESTLRLKINWKLSEETSIKFLVTEIDMNDPADIWTIDGSLNTLSNRPGLDSQKTNAYGLKFFHNFNGFEFQSLTSTTDTDVIFSYDADWGNASSHAPYTYDYFSETLRGRKSFSQEFRLLSNPIGTSASLPIEWVVGLNYFDIKESNLKNDDGAYGDPSDPYGPYLSQSSSSSIYTSENLSFFGSLDYFVDETTKISFGIRSEDWDADYSDSFGESFNPSKRMTGGKFSITKTLINGSTVFTSIAKGYKQGGFNLGLGLAADSTNRNIYYDPEFLTNYEVGINSKVFLSKLNIGAVIFFSDRKDQQVSISTQVDPSDPNTFSYLTQNAAEGTNYGLELSMDTELTDSLSLFANLGILKTEIKNWESRTDLEGRAQAHAPEKSFSLGMNWKTTARTYLSLDVTGKSSFYYSDSHNNKSRSYSLANISYGYRKDSWNYEIWVRNLFNTYYSTRGFYFGNEAPNFEDTLYKRHGDPRHLGISVRYDF